MRMPGWIHSIHHLSRYEDNSKMIDNHFAEPKTFSVMEQEHLLVTRLKPLLWVRYSESKAFTSDLSSPT